MTAKDWIKLHPTTVKHLARGYSVCDIAGCEQRRDSGEYLAIGLWVWRVWLLLRVRGRAEHERHEDARERARLCRVAAARVLTIRVASVFTIVFSPSLRSGIYTRR